LPAKAFNSNGYATTTWGVTQTADLVLQFVTCITVSPDVGWGVAAAAGNGSGVTYPQVTVGVNYQQTSSALSGQTVNGTATAAGYAVSIVAAIAGVVAFDPTKFLMN
jgi:hypothetical protein